MDLREFVRASLTDIVHGVEEAQAEVSEVDCLLNPTVPSLPAGATYVNKSGHFAMVQQVEFDVAVTASTAEGKEAKAGIEVVGISLGLGVKGNTQSEAMSVSRLRFNVPIVLPSTKSESRR